MARPSIPSYFASIEKSLGLPKGFLTGSYGIESNFGANAGTSSAGAYGPFQFIPSTARSYGLTDRGDLQASAQAAAAYAADNARLLTNALGRPPTAQELYIAHQQGVQGAVALLLNPDVPAYKAVGSVARIRQNLPKGLQARAKTMTAKEFFDHWSGEFQRRVQMATAPDYDPLTGQMRPEQVASDPYERAFLAATPYTQASLIAPPTSAQPVQVIHPAAAPPDVPQISPFTRGQIVDPYGKVPEYGNKGELQRPMFRQWNPDPIGNSPSLLAGVNPALQQVVDRARQIAGPSLQFAVGSGKRTPEQQKLAAQYGWSRVSKGGTHEEGRAIDAWPVVNGQIVFDPDRMNAIGAAMTQAAQELGIPMTWGKNFKAGPDIPHFEIGANVQPKDPFGVEAAKEAGNLPASVPLPRPRPQPVDLAATGIAGQPPGVSVSGTIPLSAPASLAATGVAGQPAGVSASGTIPLTSPASLAAMGMAGQPAGVNVSGSIPLVSQTNLAKAGTVASLAAPKVYAGNGPGRAPSGPLSSPIYAQPQTSGVSFSAPQFVSGSQSTAPARIVANPQPKPLVTSPAVSGVTFGGPEVKPPSPTAAQFGLNLSDMGTAAAMQAAVQAPTQAPAATTVAPVQKVEITPPMASYVPPKKPQTPAYWQAGPKFGIFGKLNKALNPGSMGQALAYPMVSYVQNPAAQAYLAGFGGGSAFTPAGFTAPNFNPVSGGSTYAYHTTGPGTGTYINSAGRTISYNVNGP